MKNDAINFESDFDYEYGIKPISQKNDLLIKKNIFRNKQQITMVVEIKWLEEHFLVILIY